MSKQSIAYRLSFYISTAIIALFLVFIFIVFKYSRELMRENVEKNAISLSTTVISKIRGYVVTTQEIGNNTALQIPYYAQNSDIDIFLKGVISRYPFIRSINVKLIKGFSPDNQIEFSVFREDSEIVEDNHIESTAKDSLIRTRATGWTEPFRSQIQNQVVSTYYTPIIIKTEMTDSLNVGYVTIDLSLSYLNDEINRIKIGDHGFAFLVSSQGTYITHPREDWILSQNIKNLSETVYKGDKRIFTDLIKNSLSGNFIAYPSILNHQKSWVHIAPVPENRWILIFVMPFSELYYDLRIMMVKMILISLTGVVIIFFVITYISKKLMNPLAQITSEIHEFSTAGRTKSFRNEVEILENSFNQIQIWYDKFKHEQEASRQNSKKIKQELEQASEIIKNIIPAEVPDFPGKDEIEICSAYKPANIIGGDLYDYFLVDENHLLLAIGDVSGKGISAALFMGVAHTLLRSNASGKSAKDIVKEMNKELFYKNHNQYFLTLFVAVLDLKTGQLNYCNAAHTTSMILKEDGSIVELGETHGLPLGLYKNREYEGSISKLSLNDMLILYTDGINETIDSEGLLFGENRLKEELQKHKGKLASEVINYLEESLREFRKEAKQIDDYSIVVLKYLPKLG
jgi:phosphoserine phosphatase RsbU/P